MSKFDVFVLARKIIEFFGLIVLAHVKAIKVTTFAACN